MSPRQTYSDHEARRILGLPADESIDDMLGGPSTPSDVNDLLSGPDDEPPLVPREPSVPEPVVFHADVPAKDQPSTELAEAIATGRALVRNLSRSKWDLGDLLLRVCGPPSEHGGDRRSSAPRHLIRLDEFVAAIDITEAQAIHYRRVAYAFPPGQRNAAVSWSVHRELADTKIDVEEKHDLIKRERWTRRSLAEYLDSLTEPPEDEPADSTAAPTATASSASSKPAPVPSPSSAPPAPETAAEPPAAPSSPPALAAVPAAPVEPGLVGIPALLVELDRARQIDRLPPPLVHEIEHLLAQLRDFLNADAA